MSGNDESDYSRCLSTCEKHKTLSDSFSSIKESFSGLVFKLIILYLVMIATSYGLFSFIPLVRGPASFIL